METDTQVIFLRSSNTTFYVIVNKHRGQLEFTMDILSEKWIINRYFEYVNDSNNVYMIKADADIIIKRIKSAWHTHYSL